MEQPTQSVTGATPQDSATSARPAKKSWFKRLDAAGSEDFRGRWSREHWMLASMFATMGALVVAIVPGFTNALHAPKATRATFALSLPTLPKSQAPVPAEDWQLVRVRKGQTLDSLFADFNLSASVKQQVLAQPGAKAALAHLRDGDQLAFDIPSPGVLRGLRFDKDDSTRVELQFDHSAVHSVVIRRPLERRLESTSGVIAGSLFSAGEKAGLSDASVIQMAKIFSYDIDMAQDLQPGDSFQVVYEDFWRDGQRVRTGDILAASFDNNGKRYFAYRYTHANGKTEYVDQDGTPLKKSFMRTPVEFTRISSGFTLVGRMHPILGYMRAHTGVDYAAPTGTPIVASGDAKMVFEGWKGGYGNCIILDHGGGYTTLYGHMSRFGHYHVGQHVDQGTTIGYVGMTGMATGPHLHYEFRINGVYHNPLSVTMPKPQPLGGEELARFRGQNATALAQLNRMQLLTHETVALKVLDAPASVKNAMKRQMVASARKLHRSRG
ncbi:MAG TPA: peptidoglycan DD-metalloendopeptidase family protein [Xanthomonadaceae bacterium]|jgi:murein DD-endopeptidase MepM/ murein hydrolase activator NlpD|nr:peptidoglycan DD-metalloendopeptidase family protein [Xanthomonadaceae bacterium]